MDFCPECGKLLYPDEKNHTILVCSKCGYKRELAKDEEVILTEEIKHDPIMDSMEVVAVSQADTTKPTKDIYCSKCQKNQKVSFWMVQTRSADESPTRFFKCTVCGETWREYD
jgi:DNA-directed RNA polymerase subunit M